jgi:hypothetical protein
MDLDIYLSAAPWHKSSYSTGGGQNCVEIAVIPGSVAIRDSKDPCGPVHVVSPDAFRDLVGRIKRGDFDL